MLEIETGLLGKELWAFINKTCVVYDTKELKREANTRRKRKAKKASAGESSTSPKTLADNPDLEVPVPKKFNINTYKGHSLGDYTSTIRCLGTTDSFSTVIVSFNLWYLFAIY